MEYNYSLFMYNRFLNQIRMFLEDKVYERIPAGVSIEEFYIENISLADKRVLICPILDRLLYGAFSDLSLDSYYSVLKGLEIEAPEIERVTFALRRYLGYSKMTAELENADIEDDEGNITDYEDDIEFMEEMDFMGANLQNEA